MKIDTDDRITELIALGFRLNEVEKIFVKGNLFFALCDVICYTKEEWNKVMDKIKEEENNA